MAFAGLALLGLGVAALRARRTLSLS